MLINVLAFEKKILSIAANSPLGAIPCQPMTKTLD
jgi:hypothetical protein